MEKSQPETVHNIVICCDFMREQLTHKCEAHGHGAECPDVIIKLDTYFWPEHYLSLVGRNASYECNYCPYCGAKVQTSCYETTKKKSSTYPNELRFLARKHFKGDKHREATSMSSTLFNAADEIESLRRIIDYTALMLETEESTLAREAERLRGALEERDE